MNASRWRSPVDNSVNVGDVERSRLRLKWLALAAWEGLIAALLGSMRWRHAGVGVLVTGALAMIAGSTACLGLLTTSRRRWAARVADHDPRILLIVGVGAAVFAFGLALTLWAT